MPRTARLIVAGVYYHVINRGNNQSQVFHEPCDYRGFLSLIEQAQERVPMTLVSACVMPNHFHLVVSPAKAGDIGRWMQWLLTTHSHRHHLRYGTSGRVWQGRYKAFPIQQDDHLLTVMRYVERNALRSGLVSRAEEWAWGSLAWRLRRSVGPELAQPPCPLPTNWGAYVNSPQSSAELEALRACVRRQRAFGSEHWLRENARRLGLPPLGRRAGRPPRAQADPAARSIRK